MAWTRFFRRKQWDTDREREIDAYIQVETDENIARGMAPAAARLAAQRRLGNTTLVREEIYRMNTVTVIESLQRDFRYALRGLAHNKGFTLVALLTLALGIGANTAIFSVVNGVLLQPLRYPQAGELVGVWHKAARSDIRGALNISPSLYFTYREQNRVFQNVGLWYTGNSSVTGSADPEQVRTLFATHDALRAIGVRPLLGRWFAEDEGGPPEIATGPIPVILTDSYWQRRFGGDRSALGRSITVDARPHFVAGVMPESFRSINGDPEIILPLRFDRNRVHLGNFSFIGVARLKSGVTLAQANADVARMLPIWMESWPPPPGGSRTMFEGVKIQPALRPLKQDVVGNTGDVLWVVMGTIGLVLLIACANVANLMLVRVEARRQDLAVRVALGAGKARIVRELLAESLLLGLLGGALGLGVAFVAVRALIYIEPANLPRLSEISIDPATLAFAIAASLISSLVFGMLPAWKYAAPETAKALRATRTATHGRERHRSRNTLVVVQVALALVLLVSAGLMIRTFQALRTVEPGFTRPGQIQSVRITIPQANVQNPEQVARAQADILEKLRAIPGVTAAGFANSLPMEGANSNDPIYIEGQDAAGRLPTIRRYKYVSPGFPQAMGTRFVAGRDITLAEIYKHRPVVLVSENLAREVWGNASAALGKRIADSSRQQYREVIGVVEDVRDNGSREPAPTTVYWPVLTEKFNGLPIFVQRSIVFAIRSPRAGTESFLNEVRQAIWSVNPNLPPFQVRTMEEIYERSMASTSFTLVMLAISGTMALLLGIIGIYGVISYAVSQQRREIGIRLALGAQQGELRRMFLRDGLVLSGIGAVLGLAAAAGLTRVMFSLLFGVSALDPTTFIAMPLILVLAALLASYLPARRASSVNPVEALKAD